jgi:hypothetical protein
MRVIQRQVAHKQGKLTLFFVGSLSFFKYGNCKKNCREAWPSASISYRDVAPQISMKLSRFVLRDIFERGTNRDGLNHRTHFQAETSGFANRGDRAV